MNKYSFSVAGAGICWGFIGYFARFLNDLGIEPLNLIGLRCGLAAFCFGLLLVFTGPKQFKIRLKDAWCFIGTGILSLFCFTFCYYNAVGMMSLSAAAILLYIAPVIVMLLSVILFGEKLNGFKVAAVALAFAGCCLVSGVTGGISITREGLLFGIGAGVGYAMYTIFCRFALKRGYSSSTINFYSCALATLASFVLGTPLETFGNVLSSWRAVVGALGMGVFSCFLPYMLYTYGLTGLENSKASVIASLEPVVASILGIVVFGESLSLPAFLGVVFVLMAVVLVSLKTKGTSSKLPTGKL